jgi:NAD(P)-dependent dehydrogenase (short-subunit alcohol dehydrogenase family)
MIGELGGRAVAVRCDVTRSEDVEAALDKVVDASGQLDNTFNNAGAEQEPKPTADTGSPAVGDHAGSALHMVCRRGDEGEKTAGTGTGRSRSWPA